MSKWANGRIGNTNHASRITLAITGASGVRYGLRLAEILADHELHLVVTEAAKTVIAHEIGDVDKVLADLDRLGCRYEETDIDAPPASGSFDVAAMIICPCSMKTLAAVAHGYAHNLVARAADVMIKEGRPLVLVPRETPLSAIHLENMLALARLGVRIVPAMPGFYHQPRTMDHLTDFVVGKVLDQLPQVAHTLYRRWGQKDPVIQA